MGRFMPGFYASKDWQAFRKAVLKERPVCEVKGCGYAAVHLDHIVSIGKGGATLSRENVQALCKSHHSQKTAKQDGGFGNKKGPEGLSASGLKVKGCGVDGVPLDPNHPWNRN